MGRSLSDGQDSNTAPGRVDVGEIKVEMRGGGRVKSVVSVRQERRRRARGVSARSRKDPPDTQTPHTRSHTHTFTEGDTPRYTT